MSTIAISDIKQIVSTNAAPISKEQRLERLANLFNQIDREFELLIDENIELRKLLTERGIPVPASITTTVPHIHITRDERDKSGTRDDLMRRIPVIKNLGKTSSKFGGSSTHLNTEEKKKKERKR